MQGVETITADNVIIEPAVISVTTHSNSLMTHLTIYIHSLFSTVYTNKRVLHFNHFENTFNRENFSIDWQLEVDRILASVSVLVSALNVDKWALSADIRFRPKVVIQHSIHFQFRRAAVGKFGGC